MDLQKLRNETPGCKNVAYFNNAGSALTTQHVLTKVTDYIEQESLVGGYQTAKEHQLEIDSFYEKAANLIGATSADEIGFCTSATDGWQRVFNSIPLTKNDKVIVFECEYVSFYLSLLHRQKKLGFQIVVVPTLENGDIDLKALESSLDSNVKLILLGHMPTQSGIINPAEEIGQLIVGKNIFYILDATQTVGQIKVDVQSIGCDALCATGRKFLRGPRGTGFFYLSKKWHRQLSPATIDVCGGKWTGNESYEFYEGAKKFETWERNYASMLGLGEAIRYLQELRIEEVEKCIKKNAMTIREKLSHLSQVTLQDPGEKQGAIITLTVKDKNCAEIVENLRQSGVIINYSQREYALLDFKSRGLQDVLRVSPHYYNSLEEIDQLITALSQQLGQ